MTAPMIAARAVSKRYRLGEAKLRTNSLREAIVNSATRRFRHRRSQPDTTFWALEDVSFDLPQGEVLGVIGRNGAGKSTLLKVLSRITEPTAGRIELRGRIASLLEVGTGFHAELTGRENVYLNGTILGMRKREIDDKFDEIVEFADVSRFIDTPVKRYSSGMYVRLAFAVAAHLEPEILVVDEVLAVGDAEFQKKCLGKLGDVAEQGRTVLFVSHNMAAISGLCSRALLLRKGRLIHDGDAQRAIELYLGEASISASDRSEWHYRRRGQRVAVEQVEMHVNGVPATAVQSGDEVAFRIAYRALSADVIGEELSVSLSIFGDGRKLVNLWTNFGQNRGLPIANEGVFECIIPRWPFRAGAMRADVYTHIGLSEEEWVEEALSFSSFDGNFYGSGVITNPGEGVVFLDHSWESHAAQ